MLFTSPLHSGQFGEVFRADYIPDGDHGNSITVAVKTTKADCSEKEKAELMKEMSVMTRLVHPNIVRLYGVVTVNVPAPWLVLEYLPYGDLKNYLKVYMYIHVYTHVHIHVHVCTSVLFTLIVGTEK